jgi:hypothetical protein
VKLKYNTTDNALEEIELDTEVEDEDEEALEEVED